MLAQCDVPVPCRCFEPSKDDLLKLFLSLPRPERLDRFADTARTAEIVGMSRRTIQLWIELGQIRAVRVGKKYQVHLDSVHGYLNECVATGC
jgi:excisionase family DNA binding protein